MDVATLEKVISRLELFLRDRRLPIVSELSINAAGPFAILISTLLSLRTKDNVTEAATRRLLQKAATPEAMAALPESDIAEAIYPVGFYRTKAATIRAVSAVLVDRYGSRVPDTIDELLKLKGVGRKTANLVVTLGYGKDGICVDTHVHRISNRFGFLRTKTPEATEFVLRETLPRRYWKEYNTLLVAFGQNICLPLSPWCSRCPVAGLCERFGVTRSR